MLDLVQHKSKIAGIGQQVVAGEVRGLWLAQSGEAAEGPFTKRLDGAKLLSQPRHFGIEVRVLALGQ